MAGLSLCVGLVAVIAWTVGREEPYRADLTHAPLAPSARAGEAAVVVQELVRSLAAGDAEAAAALAPAGDDHFLDIGFVARVGGGRGGVGGRRNLLRLDRRGSDEQDGREEADRGSWCRHGPGP